MMQNTTPAMLHNSCNNNSMFLVLSSYFLASFLTLFFFSCIQHTTQWHILLSPTSEFTWDPNTCHLPHCYYDYSIISYLDYSKNLLSALPSSILVQLKSILYTHGQNAALSDHVTSLTQTHPVTCHLKKKKKPKNCKGLQSPI